MALFKSPSAFIEGIDVKPEANAFMMAAPEAAGLEAGETDFVQLEDKDAFINAGSVLAFTDEITDSAIKQMVLDSTLFAQLAANAQHDRMTDPSGWYQRYQAVLTNLGWSIGSFTLIKQDFSKTRIELADSAIDLMTRMLGGLSLEILEAALNSMRKMAGEDDLITLFDGNSLNDTVANFQVGQASFDEDENVAMPVGMFFFRSSQQKRNFLFFRWKRKQVTLFGDVQVITLNIPQYEIVADVVKDKLAESRLRLVKAVPLD